MDALEIITVPANAMRPVRSLEDLEAIIERGLGTFIEVGLAILEIREGHRYRERGYQTFEDYSAEYLEMAWQRAYQYCDAARVWGLLSKKLENGAPLPSRDSHARALLPLKDDPDRLTAAWRDALATATNGTRLTASHISATVDRHLQSCRPSSIRCRTGWRWTTATGKRRSPGGTPNTPSTPSRATASSGPSGRGIRSRGASTTAATATPGTSPCATTSRASPRPSCPTDWTGRARRRCRSERSRMSPSGTCLPARWPISSASGARRLDRGRVGGRAGESAVELPVSDQVPHPAAGVRLPGQRLGRDDGGCPGAGGERGAGFRPGGGEGQVVVLRAPPGAPAVPALGPLPVGGAGGASRSSETPEWHPPRTWVDDLERQAREAGCRIYEKTNLLERHREYPGQPPRPRIVVPDAFKMGYLQRDVLEPETYAAEVAS